MGRPWPLGTTSTGTSVGGDRWLTDEVRVPDPLLASLVDDSVEGTELLAETPDDASETVGHTLTHLAGALRALGDADVIESSPQASGSSGPS